MKYKRDGTLLCSRTYMKNFTPFKVWTPSRFRKNGHTVTGDLESRGFSGVNTKKVEDVQDLFKFLKPSRRDWL